MMGAMSSTLRFAHAVRTLSEAARLQGLEVPIFRTPPGRSGAVRTIRRTRRGATVAVRVTERPWVAVLADLVDGVVVVNGLDGGRAIRCRTALWAALEREEVLAA
jgi:hypothetical protein